MRPRLSLQSVVLPMFVLFAATYLFLLQNSIPHNSQTLLIFKLAAGAVILGGFSYYLRGHIRGRLGVPLRDIDWPLVIVCVVCGLMLLHLSLFLHRTFGLPFDVQRGLLYYGPFSTSSFELYAIIPLLILYVIAEEAYFRGVLYGYLKQTLSLPFAIAAASVLFMLAHLNVLVPRFAMLVGLSLIAIWLYEKTGTLFYAIIVHATLNVASVLLITDALFRLSSSLWIRFAVLSVVGIAGLVVILAPGKRRMITKRISRQ